MKIFIFRTQTGGGGGVNIHVFGLIKEELWFQAIENRMKRESNPQHYLRGRKILLSLTVKRVNALIGSYSIGLSESISKKGDIYTTSRICYQLIGYFNIIKHLKPPFYHKNILIHEKKTSLPRVTTNNPRVTTA